MISLINFLFYFIVFVEILGAVKDLSLEEN